MNLGPKDNYHLAENSYVMISLPIIFGMLAAVSPTSSTLGFWTLGVYVLLNVICIFYGKIKKLHNYVGFRVVYTIVQIDITVFCIIIVFWRHYQSILLILILLLPLMLCAIIGNHYRSVINQELRAPKTRFGRMIYAIGSIGAGAAGLSAYVISSGSPVAVTFGVLYVLMLSLVVIFHAQWLYVKKPKWEPK